MLYLLLEGLESRWQSLTNHMLKIVYQNDKDQRLGQRKRKAYKKRESVTKKRKTFDIRELSSSSKITTDNKNTSDDELN